MVYVTADDAFMYYRSGILECLGEYDVTDHAVTLVGYGSNYWII